MAKIPFSIKHREKIESGEYKVFAHEHVEQEARIVCWDNKGKYPIVALVDNEPEKFDKYGRVPGGNRGGEFSLFLVTPEPELTEFEKKLIQFSDERNSMECDNLPEDREEEILADHLHRKAAELLTLARKQLQPEIDAEIEKAYKNADEVQYRKGREEALKDLPRWKKCGEYTLRTYGEEHFEYRGDGRYLVVKGMEILLSDLEKLPGFKEDE